MKTIRFTVILMSLLATSVSLAWMVFPVQSHADPGGEEPGDEIEYPEDIEDIEDYADEVGQEIDIPEEGEDIADGEEVEDHADAFDDGSDSHGDIDNSEDTEQSNDDSDHADTGRDHADGDDVDTKSDGDSDTAGTHATGQNGKSGHVLAASKEELDEDEFVVQQDRDGHLALSGEWLVLLNPDELVSLTEHGFSANDIDHLDGLNKILARVEAPVGYSLARVKREISKFSSETRVDYNHLYETRSAKRHEKGRGIEPRTALDTAPFNLGEGLKIGMIDTRINKSLPVFQRARIRDKDFIDYKFTRPRHGTSVASILVGESDGYRGLAPKAELYTASVFFNSPIGGERATTENLVQAIDWMVQNNVNVINMSLAGPPNAILQAAIKSAQKKGVIILAAVGNDGPTAKPLYPAAYEGVIAVTAVNVNNKIYRLANRGPHVDFAAPGVAIRTATGDGAFRASTGTSFAAPFAAVILSATNAYYMKDTQKTIISLQKSALDLGPKGFDPIYGYGRITPLPNLKAVPEKN